MGARRGVAMFQGQQKGVIAKPCTPAELAAECFCGMFANDLLISAPPCGIVLERGDWWFASVDVGAPNLVQAVGIADPINPDPALVAVVAQELSTWLGIGRLLAFDVLVHNGDRNAGNLLTDGNDWWAIDHARAMELYPWSKHRLYQLIAAQCGKLAAANVEASAIAQALTFPAGCHSLAAGDLLETGPVSSFAAPFAQQIIRRLPTLASVLPGLL